MRAGASRARAAALWLVAAALPLAARGGEPFLHVIPLSVREGARVDGSRPLLVTPRAGPDAEAAARAGAPAPVVELDRYRPLDAEPPAAYLGPSFVLDFDAPAVAALAREAAARLGAEPSIEALVVFTDAAIAEKSVTRGFDVASQVATHRSGDCSEHAVLLAALARAFGRPARVVFGVLVASQDGRLAAFGHAWAEIHDGAGWQRADATPWEGVARLGYVPVGLLADEGPGYALGMLAPLRSPWFRGVEVIGNAAPDPAPARRGDPG